MTNGTDMENLFAELRALKSDHFLYSHDLNAWLVNDAVRRDKKPITPRFQGKFSVKNCSIFKSQSIKITTRSLLSASALSSREETDDDSEWQFPWWFN